MGTCIFVSLSMVLTAAAAFAQPLDEKRPALLMPLYSAHVMLHSLDVHSTLTALERGHQEGNPLFRRATPSGMIAAKAAVGAGMIVITEKVWKRNRKAAVIMMIASNAALSMAVSNNYRIAGS